MFSQHGNNFQILKSDIAHQDYGGDARGKKDPCGEVGEVQHTSLLISCPFGAIHIIFRPLPRVLHPVAKPSPIFSHAIANFE